MSSERMDVVEKLRFVDDDGNEFPEWDEATLGEVGEWSRGFGIPKKSLSANGAFKCIHYGELFGANVIFYSSNRTDKKWKRLGKQNDVLIPCSDVTKDGLATASVLMEDGVFLGGDINILSPKEGIDGVFVAYAIRSKKNQVLRMVTGTTVKHISPSQLSKLPIPLPSLPEQKKIAEFLGSLDEDIATHERRLAALKDLKRAYSQRIFA